MSGFIQVVVGSLVTALLLGFLARLALRGRPDALDHATHRIRPSRPIFIGLALGCCALGGFALYAAAYHGGGIAAVCVGAPFTFFGLLTFGALSPRFDVTWDPNGLSGPTNSWMPPFGPSRGAMDFVDIAEAGVDRLGSLYVQDAAGKRIRWNEYYSGHGALAEQIAFVRPDLFDDLPDDDR